MNEFEITVFGSRITFETAKGIRTCKGFGCDNIHRGETHLAVYRSGSQPIRDNYCLPHACEFLEGLQENAAYAVTAADLLDAELRKLGV